jgi:hypothetical protein
MPPRLAAARSASRWPSQRPRRSNRPAASATVYIFVSTRPADNVKNEVSVIIGYPFKTSSDATAEVGAVVRDVHAERRRLIKNVAEEARMVEPCAKAPT